MGAGKSSIGKKLAVQLGLDYYDLDTEVEKDSGYTITETVFNKGELFFRKEEKEKLDEILSKDNFVLSCGGGTPCYYDNMDRINANSISVYLRYNVPVLYDRLEGHQAERPLIAHLEGEQLREYIGKHLFERGEFYEKAIFVIDGNQKEDNEIIKELIALINE